MVDVVANWTRCVIWGGVVYTWKHFSDVVFGLTKYNFNFFFKNKLFIKFLELQILDKLMKLFLPCKVVL